MKTVVTPLISWLMIGVLVASGLLVSKGHKDLGVLEWCLIICALLLVAWLIAMLLNVAIFAPVYWLLGRLQSKKSKTQEKRENDP